MLITAHIEGPAVKMNVSGSLAEPAVRFWAAEKPMVAGQTELEKIPGWVMQLAGSYVMVDTLIGAFGNRVINHE